MDVDRKGIEPAKRVIRLVICTCASSCGPGDGWGGGATVAATSEPSIGSEVVAVGDGQRSTAADELSGQSQGAGGEN